MRAPLVVVGLLSSLGLAVLSQLYLPLPLFGTIAGTYGVSTGTAGLVSTVFGLSYACGQLFFGTLSDRVGRRAVMAAGMGALALTSLLVGLLSSFGGVLAARTLQGFVAAALPVVAISYLPEQLPDRLKAFGIGCISAAFLLAGLLGQLYGAAAGGLSAAVLPLAAVYAVGAGLVALLPEERRRADGPGGLLSAYRRMWSLLADGALARAYGGTLAALFAFVGFYSALGLFGGEVIAAAGLSLTTVRAVGAPAVLLALVAPGFIVRYGPRSVVRAGFATGSAGLFTAAAAAATSGFGVAGAVWLLVAASVVFVAGVSIVVPGLVALVGSLAPDRRGAANSLYGFVLFVGASLGAQFPPLVSGFVGAGASGIFTVCATLGCLYAAAALLNAGAAKSQAPQQGS